MAGWAVGERTRLWPASSRLCSMAPRLGREAAVEAGERERGTDGEAVEAPPEEGQIQPPQQRRPHHQVELRRDRTHAVQEVLPHKPLDVLLERCLQPRLRPRCLSFIRTSAQECAQRRVRQKHTRVRPSLVPVLPRASHPGCELGREEALMRQLLQQLQPQQSSPRVLAS
eukprot:2246270-Rhodomonas_salina.1